ncbi:HK97 family phage prohead protease [Epibacterium sp. Ofav1-8]|uniref:HK97 family phage prohead protease n=1 Tax=Epibacterium sp. Ofav1-8 TaxID=2917735 RepID=UPI001EF40ACC|nr:HK97 family phage prohead protease [Epibacterium sp. Ofav1-8]MCG7623016.1 HK97 family phage prohead protease [Epibacterium sp. Ofav1-8]
MLWGAHTGSIELRNEGGETRLRATFPYGLETVLAERVGMGRERREMIAARAFADRIERGEDVHFLSGHDFNKPLASRSAGTLTLTETDNALTVEATISADMGQVSYVRDFLSAHAAGLVRGLSPGFRVRPGGEAVEERGNAILRTIKAADLIEISAVTKPAYPQAQIEARNWQPIGEVVKRLTHRPAAIRWR